MEFSCLESKEVFDLPQSSKPTTKAADSELEESTSEEQSSALTTDDAAEEENLIAAEVKLGLIFCCSRYPLWFH